MRSKVHLSLLGDYLKDLLDTGPCRGRVLNVHAGIINVEVQGLVWSVGQDTILAPGPLTALGSFSLNCMAMHQGAVMEASPQSLFFPHQNWSFDLSQASVYPSPYRRREGWEKAFAEGYELLKGLLFRQGNQEGLAMIGQSFATMETVENPLCLALKGALAENSIHPLTWYVGRGPGLTPTGDDVLAGILAVLSYAGLIEEWDLSIWQEKTHPLAYTSLYLSRMGRPPRGLKRVVESLMAGEKKDLIRCARELLDQGSTSGTDILYGLVLAVGYLTAEEEKHGRGHSIFVPKRCAGH